jgi:3-oxoacyl-[acyl-carrier protein] reductase
MYLKDEVALITGAGRGIGRAVAENFASHGCHLYLNDVAEDRLADVCRSLTGKHDVNVTPLAYDVSDYDAVKKAFQTIFKQSKKLDILVNNAGIFHDALLPMASKNLIQAQVQTNILGTLYHIQGASRLMTRHRKGTIINLSSIIGRYGHEGQVIYGATKAAVIGATLSAAKELAEHNIRVNAIAPGFVSTEMTAQLAERSIEAAVSSIRMGRPADPQDIANVALFLASGLSTYVTGQVIGVDGSMTI